MGALTVRIRQAACSTVWLLAACSPAPQPSAIQAPPATTAATPPAASTSAASAAPVDQPVLANCGAAAPADTAGQALAPAYAELAQSLEAAACHHDYVTLAGSMDSTFTYEADGTRGSPDEVVAAWKSAYPTGRNLDSLAKALTAPPAFKQGSYTFRSGGATVILARHRWTGFFYGTPT